MIFVELYASPAAVADALAAQIHTEITVAAASGRRYLLGLPSGRSATLMLSRLVRLLRSSRTRISSVVLVMMDEYLEQDGNSFRTVDASAGHSGRGYAERTVCDPLTRQTPAPGRPQVWVPDPSDPAAFDTGLEHAGGLDRFVVASGTTDGHIGFNPPGSPRHARTRVVELSQETRQDNLRTFPHLGHLDQVPRHGVTVGIDTIAGLSRAVSLVATGAEKATAVRRILDGEVYDPAWPATIVRECQQASLLVDEQALSSGPQLEV